MEYGNSLSRIVCTNARLVYTYKCSVCSNECAYLYTQCVRQMGVGLDIMMFVIRIKN